jgi:hypothetical protein
MSAPSTEALVAVLLELDRLRGLTLDILEREGEPLWPAPDGSSGPADALYGLLVGVRRLVMGHPSAARAMLDLLVAEGRRYATTPAGKELRDVLVASEAVGELRRVWDTVTLNVLDGPATPSGIPEAWSELLADAIAARSVGDAVQRLKPEGFA